MASLMWSHKAFNSGCSVLSMWILDWSWQVYRPLTLYLCRNPQNQVAWLVEPSLSPLSTHPWVSSFWANFAERAAHSSIPRVLPASLHVCKKDCRLDWKIV